MLSSNSSAVAGFVSAFRELGCNGSDDQIKAILLACNNSLDLAVNRWLERGFTGVIVAPSRTKPVVELLSPERKIDLSDSDSDHSDDKMVSLKQIKYSQTFDDVVVKKDEECNEVDYLFIGKRNIDESYTLTEGTYAVRQQSLGFRLEGNGTDSSYNSKKKKSTSATKGSKLKVPGEVVAALSSKEKFSGGKLLFYTFNQDNFKATSQQRDCEGRLPNWVCDFLVPLLRSKLVVLKGHVCYDRGAIKRFDYIPLCIHIYLSKNIFTLNSGTGTLQIDKSITDDCLQDLSDLCLWLLEGKDACLASRHQRQKEAAGHHGLTAPVTKQSSSTSSSSHGTVTTANQNSTTDLVALDKSLDVTATENEGEQTMSVDELKATNTITSLPLATQPSIMSESITMKPYQLQALEWMKSREKGDPQISMEIGSNLLDYIHISKIPYEGLIQISPCKTIDGFSDNPLWLPIVGVAVQAKIPPQDITSYVSTVGKGALQLLFWNRYSTVFSKNLPKKPQPCNGGILADEMGMGKTVMCLSLIASDHDSSVVNYQENTFRTSQSRKSGKKSKIESDEDNENISQRSNIELEPSQGRKRSKKAPLLGGTLIVAPMSLMNQWVEEANAKMKENVISTMMYYGSNRLDSKYLQQYGIVVTSYGVIVSEAKALSRTMEEMNGVDSCNPDVMMSIRDQIDGLFSIKWKRVVLDEAHTIKNPATEAAKACCLIDAVNRWALTGTPIQNSLTDMYSIVKYLHHEPFDSYRFWKKTIADPQASNDPRGMEILRGLLHNIMLRRTKDMCDISGEKIVVLPDKKIFIEYVDLIEPEREFYDAIVHRSKQVFRGYDNSTLRSKYAFLFTLLMRMRQACDHPYLVMSKLDEGDEARKITEDSSNSNSAKAKNPSKEESAEDTDVDMSQLFGNDFLAALYGKLKTSIAVQQCSDTNLVESTGYINQVMHNLKSLDSANKLPENEIECPVCLETPSLSSACILPCGHIFCIACARTTIHKFQNCTVCLKPCTVQGLVPLTNVNKPKIETTAITGKSIVQTMSSGAYISTGNLTSNPAENWRNWNRDRFIKSNSKAANDAKYDMKNHQSSKINTILHILATVFSRPITPTSSSSGTTLKPIKVVIFSQWTSMLDIIENALNSVHYKFRRLDGTMNQTSRAQSINQFNNDNDVRILLISLRAGGVGLNLTAASVIILTDPWFNGSVEDQAMDRVHRLGQLRDVEVYRLICRDSVEVRLLELQQKKKQLSQQAIGVAENRGDAKLSLQDLVSFFV